MAIQQEPFTATMWPLTQGEMPTSRYNVLTAVLPSNELLVVGGYSAAATITTSTTTTTIASVNEL